MGLGRIRARMDVLKARKKLTVKARARVWAKVSAMVRLRVSSTRASVKRDGEDVGPLGLRV